MKQFNIPEFYRSPIISKVKAQRKADDPRKKDFSPTVLKYGKIEFLIARHFGFCYGVENAIEIAYKAIHENPGKRPRPPLRNRQRPRRRHPKALEERTGLCGSALVEVSIYQVRSTE